MKILGIILVALGVCKGLTIKGVSLKDIPKDELVGTEPQISLDTANNIARCLFILEIVLEIICGLFIAFL